MKNVKLALNSTRPNEMPYTHRINNILEYCRSLVLECCKINCLKKEIKLTIKLFYNLLIINFNKLMYGNLPIRWAHTHVYVSLCVPVS